MRNVLLALLASLAKVEAQKISERTKAGMARAKAQGKRIGRPGLERHVQQTIVKRLSTGASRYRVAKDLGIDRKTVLKYGTQ